MKLSYPFFLFFKELGYNKALQIIIGIMLILLGLRLR